MYRSSILVLLLLSPSVLSQDSVTFQEAPGKVKIFVGKHRFATWRWKDKAISRPYFEHLMAPNGLQVTRNNPPQKGDLQDHSTYHPGLFMAFGDLNGNDNWRLKAPVAQKQLLQKPRSKDTEGSFAVRLLYLDGKGKEFCEQDCHFRFIPQKNGTWLIWNSTFRATESDIYFGDQEEMGLGARMATAISVNQKKGGRILNSEGRINGKAVWGRQAQWCDYSGTVGTLSGGITLMPHPKNFRASWFHARDYGFLAANPFGRQAFTRGKKSKIILKKGGTLPLRFGVYIHNGIPGQKKLEAAYQYYLEHLSD